MIDFVRVKTDEDIKLLADTASKIWHEYFTFLLKSEQIDYMLGKYLSFEAIRTQFEEGYEYYFIFFEDKLAGFTGFCPEKEYLFLSKLYVKKVLRNKGIGRKSLEFIKSATKQHGLKRINLTVNKYNESTIKAYKKWGFETVDSVVTDIGGGFVMDDYIMEMKVI